MFHKLYNNIQLSKIMAKTKTRNKNSRIARTGFILATIFIFSLIIVACTKTSSYAQTNNNTNANQQTTTNQNANTGKVLFSTSQYAANSYLISGETLDSAAQTATSGFNIQKSTLPDGSLQINLTSTNPEYHDQTYTLTAGQKLYFIEAFLGDDSDNREANLGDDTAIVVDADGYIVQ
jgi:hypothetical protein